MSNGAPHDQRGTPPIFEDRADVCPTYSLSPLLTQFSLSLSLASLTTLGPPPLHILSTITPFLLKEPFQRVNRFFERDFGTILQGFTFENTFIGYLFSWD